VANYLKILHPELVEDSVDDLEEFKKIKKIFQYKEIREDQN